MELAGITCTLPNGAGNSSEVVVTLNGKSATGTLAFAPPNIVSIEVRYVYTHLLLLVA